MWSLSPPSRSPSLNALKNSQSILPTPTPWGAQWPSTVALPTRAIPSPIPPSRRAWVRGYFPLGRCDNNHLHNRGKTYSVPFFLLNNLQLCGCGLGSFWFFPGPGCCQSCIQVFWLNVRLQFLPHANFLPSVSSILCITQFTGAQFTGAQLSDIGSDTWQRPPSMLSLSSRTPRSLDSFFSSSHSQFLPARSTKHSASVSAIVHAGRTHDVPRVKRHFSTSDVILKSSSYVLQSRSRYTSLPPMETYVSSSLSRESLPADKGKQKPATGPKPRKGEYQNWAIVNRLKS